MFGQNLRSRVSDRRNGGAHSSRARLATGENEARDEAQQADVRPNRNGKKAYTHFTTFGWLALARALGVCFPRLHWFFTAL